MNKAIKYLTNFIIHATLGSILLFGGGMMWMALNTDATPWWGGFYFGLIVAAIPLWVWGIVGRLMRLPWQPFKLIHQRWWSAIAFWVGTTFVGLLPPYALIGWIVSVILASPRQVGINRFALRMIFGMMTLAGLWVQLVLS